MERTELKPVEQLYFISKEDATIYTKKNILYSLIYQLIESRNIIPIDKNKFNISFLGESFTTEYEETFLQLINNKKYLELDNFINGLRFEKTLVTHKYLEESIKEGKMFFIISVPKLDLKKSVKYYEHQAYFKKLLIDTPNVLRIICPKIELERKIINVYNILVDEMQKAQKEQEKKQKERSEEDIGNMFGINEK